MSSTSSSDCHATFEYALRTRKSSNQKFTLNNKNILIGRFWNMSMNFPVWFLYLYYKTVQSEQSIYLMQCSDWLFFRMYYKIVQSEQSIYLMQYSDWLIFQSQVQTCAKMFFSSKARCRLQNNSIYSPWNFKQCSHRMVIRKWRFTVS